MSRIKTAAAFIVTLGSLAVIGGCKSSSAPGQGISHDYGDNVSSDAKSVATGTGMVTFRATEIGKAYVLDWSRSDDQSKDKFVPHVIRVARLLKGQGITVDASKQTITVGPIGNTTETVFKDVDLKPENKYEILFDTSEHLF